MAWDATDWTISVTGDIRYTGDAHGGASPTYITGLELHREIGKLADDANANSASLDLVDIASNTPSDRQGVDQIIKLLNGYNIDQTASEHIYDASIIQGSGDTEEIWDAIVNFGNATYIDIIQNGARLTNNFWNQGGAGLNPDAGLGISHRFIVKVREDGVDIDNRRLIGTTREFGNTYGVSNIAATSRGNNVFSLSESNDPFNNTAAGTVATWTSVIFTEGYQLIDIDNDTVGEPYFVEADIGTQTIRDTYEVSKYDQRRGTAETLFGLPGDVFRGVTHEWDYDAEAGGAPATTEEYAWGLNVAYDNQLVSNFVVGEAVHFNGSNAIRGRVLADDDNGGTGNLIVAMEAGTVADNDTILGVTSGTTADVFGTPVGQATGGGVARILAVDDQGTTGTVWVQLMKGTTPGDNAICYDDLNATKTLTVDGAVTSRDLTPTFLGTSTGTNIIGGFGVGFQPADVGSSDSFTDLTAASNTPPNNQTFSVNGLTSGEDYVLVGPRTGSSINKTQMTLLTTLSGATESQAVMTASIPTDTPTTGTIRIVTDAGLDRRVEYSSYTSATFTFTSSEDFTGDNATGNGVWVSYIDKLAAATTESFSAVFGSTRDLFVRVRDGGTAGDAIPIKTFEDVLAQFTASGGSSSVLRLSDA